MTTVGTKFPKCCECGSYFGVEAKWINREDDDFDYFCWKCLDVERYYNPPICEAYGYAWQTHAEDFIPF